VVKDKAYYAELLGTNSKPCGQFYFWPRRLSL